MNNAYLAMRIQHIILEEYQDDIQGRSESRLKFFVRNKVVQKAYHHEAYELVEEEMVLENPKDGMSKATMKVFFRLIEKALKRHRKISYAHIYISYKLNDSRDGLEKMRIEIENEKHYRIIS